MRIMVAAGLLALAPLAGERPPIQQTPAAAQQTPAPAQQTPPATAKPAETPASPMAAPKLPPFAGEIVNFDRRGPRVVACVDAAKVKPPTRMGPDGKPITPPADAPAPQSGPPRLRIWVIEREVMQELLTTSGLCDPVWAPDGKTFAAAGGRGVFTFTEPNFEPRVLVAGQLQAPAPGAPPAREFDDPAWSPSGARLAFRSSASGSGRVEVVDVKSAEVVLKRDGAAKALRWADEKTLIVDGTRVPVP
jgi:Tol biopolymer transport system component